MELKTAAVFQVTGATARGMTWSATRRRMGPSSSYAKKGSATGPALSSMAKVRVLIQNIKHAGQSCFNLKYYSAAKNETLYYMLSMTVFQSAFRRRNCPERLLHKKVWYCSSTEFIIKITILFSARCSTWSVKITSVVLKVKNFAIAAIICAIIRKRLAKVSRSCSGWASLLPPWPRDAAELISWHVYCSVLVLSSLGAKYNKFAVIHAWRNAIDLIPETIWY